MTTLVVDVWGEIISHLIDHSYKSILELSRVSKTLYDYINAKIPDIGYRYFKYELEKMGEWRGLFSHVYCFRSIKFVKFGREYGPPIDVKRNIIINTKMISIELNYKLKSLVLSYPITDLHKNWKLSAVIIPASNNN